MVKSGKKYKAFKVNTGISKKNSPYTRFNISDSYKDGEKWENTYFTCFFWGGALDMKDGDYVIIEQIDGIEAKKKTYGDKVYFDNILIVGSVELLNDSTATPTAKTEATPFDDEKNDDNLPF